MDYPSVEIRMVQHRYRDDALGEDWVYMLGGLVKVDLPMVGLGQLLQLQGYVCSLMPHQLG